MPKFQYSAIRDNGERVTGEIEGSDRSMVLGRLGEQGLHPIEVKDAELDISAGAHVAAWAAAPPVSPKFRSSPANWAGCLRPA